MDKGLPRITANQIRDAKEILCDCGHGIFTEKMMFKRISPIISPTGKEEVFPMPLVICEKCGKVPTFFNQDGLIPKKYIAELIIEKDYKEVSS